MTGLKRYQYMLDLERWEVLTWNQDLKDWVFMGSFGAYYHVVEEAPQEYWDEML